MTIMNRLFAALTICAFLAGTASAYEPAKPSKPATTKVAPDEPDDATELLTLMNETESPDTFLIAVEALAGLEPERKGLIAAVVRNADRLGLLKGVASGKVTEHQEVITKMLEKLVQARTEGRNRGRTSSHRYCVPPQQLPVAPVLGDNAVPAPLLAR
jgi:hypothetical protein